MHILDIIEPDISLDSNILKQKLKYFGHMRDDNPLENTINSLGAGEYVRRQTSRMNYKHAARRNLERQTDKQTGR
jgi:hypothetical protein